TSLFTSGESGLYRWPITADPELGKGGVRIGPAQRLSAPTRRANVAANVALSRDGHFLAVDDGEHGRVLVLDLLAPGKEVVLEPDPNIGYVAISPDGHWVVTGSNRSSEGTVKVWDARTGQLARELLREAMWE